MTPPSSCKTHFLITFLIISYLFSSQTEALKPPFRPIINSLSGILPLLPRQVSWPSLINSLSGFNDLLPAFVGSATPTNKSLGWKGACFNENSAWLDFHNKTGSEFGGGTLHIKVSDPQSWICTDVYVFATPYRVTWDYYFKSREHTVEFDKWEGKAEYEYVKSKGVSIFLMEGGVLGTLVALADVIPLFENSESGETANIEFLKNHMETSIEERPHPWVTNNINIEEIHSGDFIAISKIRGRWGAFETLEKWVTGAYAGHSAVFLKDPQGKLWVGESGHDDGKGGDVIAVLPWDEWWDFELTKDDANPHIAILPLHPDIRAKFNETAAWDYARSMQGKPYGYHNVIFSWIDTVDGNYPPPMSDHLVASAMTICSHILPANAIKLWNEALNKRLGTQGIGISEILVELEKRGSSFGQLLAIPEQDDWTYVDGKSTSCVAFVVEMYKAAGLFGTIANSIQATEFTIRDAYTLKFFENDLLRLPKWCNNGDTVKLPFCQIRGQYRMELPEYNTVDPYPHMNERCPSLPPKYSRPKDC